MKHRSLILAVLFLVGGAAYGMHYWRRLPTFYVYGAGNGATTAWRKTPTDSAFWQCVNEATSKQMATDFWYWHRDAAYARVDTAYPNAVGDISEWTASSGTAKYDLVDEVTCSGTDYVYSALESKAQYFSTNVDTTVLGIIDSARILGQFNNSEDTEFGDTVWVYFDTSGTDTWKKSVWCPLNTVTSFTTAPITNLTRAKLKTMQIGVKTKTSRNDVPQLDCIRLQIFSTVPTQGDSLAVACFVDPQVDTTALPPDSVRIGIRGTHTGAGYKRIILECDTNGTVFKNDTLDLRGNRDTLYSVADGDTNQWGYVTSPNYTNIDERVPSGSDYVAPAITGSPFSEQYKIEIDTSYDAILDSIRILGWFYTPEGSGDPSLVQIRHNIGGWTIIDTAETPNAYGTLYKVSRKIATPTKAQMANLQIGFTKIVNGVNVRLRWCAVERFFSNNVYHTIYSKHALTGLTNRQLSLLEIGVLQIDTCDTGESLKVSQFFLQGFRPDTADSDHLIFSDTSDFVIGQISASVTDDDIWNGATVRIGKNNDSLYRALLVIRNTDSIPFVVQAYLYNLDSAFLYLRCKTRTGWPGYLIGDNISEGSVDADSNKAAYPSTGSKVAYEHSNWLYRNAHDADSTLWDAAGANDTADIGAEWDWGYADADTGIWVSSTTYKMNIMGLIGSMATISPGKRSRFNALRFVISKEDSSTGRYLDLGNVMPFGTGVDTSWIEIFRTVDENQSPTFGGKYADYPHLGATACGTIPLQCNNFIRGSPFTASETGTIDYIGGCLYPASSSIPYNYAVYRSVGEWPTGYTFVDSTAWKVSSFYKDWDSIAAQVKTENAIVSGTRYWIFGRSARAGFATGYIEYVSASSGDTIARISNGSTGYGIVWPATLNPTAWTANQLLSIYLAYHTTGAPAGVKARRRRQQIGDADSVQYRVVILSGGRQADVPRDRMDSVMAAWGLR